MSHFQDLFSLLCRTRVFRFWLFQPWDLLLAPVPSRFLAPAAASPAGMDPTGIEDVGAARRSPGAELWDEAPGTRDLCSQGSQGGSGGSRSSLQHSRGLLWVHFEDGPGAEFWDEPTGTRDFRSVGSQGGSRSSLRNSRGSQHRLLRAGAEDGPRECHEHRRREDDDSGSAAGNHAGMAGAGGRRPRALPLEFRAHLGETRENLQPEQQKCLGITQFIPVYSKILGGKIFEYLFI